MATPSALLISADGSITTVRIDASMNKQSGEIICMQICKTLGILPFTNIHASLSNGTAGNTCTVGGTVTVNSSPNDTVNNKMGYSLFYGRVVVVYCVQDGAGRLRATALTAQLFSTAKIVVKPSQYNKIKMIQKSQQPAVPAVYVAPSSTTTTITTTPVANMPPLHPAPPPPQIVPQPPPPQQQYQPEQWLAFDEEGPLGIPLTDPPPDDSIIDLETASISNAMEFDQLLALFPQSLSAEIKSIDCESPVEEVFIDNGRPIGVRCSNNNKHYLDHIRHNVIMEQVWDKLVSVLRTQAQHFEGHPLDLFTSDHRAGLASSLHRISLVLGWTDIPDGITYRVGRHLPGMSTILTDVIADLHTDSEPKSLLLVGPPGVGKTTMLRDITDRLSTELMKSVFIVDTSSEIAGFGAVPHQAIGNSRRIRLKNRKLQHEVLVEMAQNHTPEVMVVDEIGNRNEVAAVATICQRGVALVATAHGKTLLTVMSNPELSPLVGGTHAVILSAGERERRDRRHMNADVAIKKTQNERKNPPVFSVLVELMNKHDLHVRIHRDIAKSVDALLSGKHPVVEERWIDETNRMRYKFVGGGPLDNEP